ncbi:MAG: ABC transporter permease [Actinomycetes bacterium]
MTWDQAGGERVASQEHAEPVGLVRFHRDLRLPTVARDLWRARALIRALTERDFRARYKQAVLGAAWSVITPILMMVVFTLVFAKSQGTSTGGAPYPLFSYLGLIPWTFFSTSVSQGSSSLISNQSLMNKIYCPREVFPLARVGLAATDMAISIGVLLVLFGVFRYPPRGTAYWVVPLLLIQFVFAAAVGMLMASLAVYFRDLLSVLPIILQVGLFATPVAYGLSTFIPARWQGLDVAVNPLGAVIDGYRRSLLLGEYPRLGLTLVGAAGAVGYLMVGYLIFKRLETGFADIA